jgi:hypothetical protein
MNDAQPVFGPREAQPFDDLLTRSETIDLDQLERILDPQGAMQLDTQLTDIAPIALAIAMSADGRKFLEWLCDVTIRRPVFTVGMNIEQGALYAASREGQNTTVHLIIKAIRRGQDKVEEAKRRS